MEDGISLPDWASLSELWQTTLGWQPNSQQQALFQQLYQEILLGNRQLNLTRITTPEDFWEKHLWDSLRGIAPYLQSAETRASLRAIDIGSGAGFPGIPVAIAQPTWQVTLLDSTRKKVAFLQTLCTHLGLENAIAIADRAEQLGQHPGHREAYDLALVRAVGAASICAEYALPFLKVGGLAILYRGQQETDRPALQAAVSQLGGAVEAVEAFATPLSQAQRHCLLLRKVTPTDYRYPRSVGIPAQQPL